METDSAGLWLIRHGEGTHNSEGFYSARPRHPQYRPAKLTELGRRQALELAEELTERGVSVGNVGKVLVSPLPRTLETARLVMNRLMTPEHKLDIDDRLIEAGVGDREGSLLELHQDSDSWFPDNPERFGGETNAEIRRRMRSVFKDINGHGQNHSAGHVLVFSHGSPLYLLIEALTGEGQRLGTARYRLIKLNNLPARD